VKSKAQELTKKINMSYDEFAGKMHRCGYGEPTALKIWGGKCEDLGNHADNNIKLSSPRRKAAALSVKAGSLIPR
jgi:hypothetical protein